VITLAQLEQAIRESWSLDTSDDPHEWSPENPSRGQCDITALVVNDLVGGKLLGADVFFGDGRVEGHMWNRLPSGIDVDLTRDQFRAGERIGEPRVSTRPAEFPTDHPRYHRYETYLVLSERVRTRLGVAG
jgi:hypothetical protein